MKLKKHFYIIPGFGETISDAPYKEIITFLKNKKYNVIFYQPKWKWNTMDRWLSDFRKILYKDSESIALGFSLGANILALSTESYTFKKVIFCSISPYFKNDLKHLPTLASKILGKRRMIAFSKYNFPETSNIPAFFIYGEKEAELIPNGNKIHFDMWKGNKKYRIVKGAEHDISNTEYIKTIKSLF